MKKILTLSQLISFCQSNDFGKFSSNESGYQLSVQIPATFKKDEDEDPTMLYGHIKLLHTSRNLNGSSLTEKAAKKAMKRLAYKPLLANFTDVNSELDFTSHDFEIDEDGNVVYLEKQIGCFTSDKPYLEEDPDDNSKKYLYAQVAIPREYTAAAEIIERKGGTAVSAELLINEMSYDSKEKVLVLDDVEIMGATCLGVDPDTGDPVKPGMAGAELKLTDFSQENNSVVSHYNRDEKLIETLEKLNETLSNFNIDKPNAQNAMTGGESMKLNELLEKYNVTEEDLDFDYSEMSDEELEAKFEELFGEKDPETNEPENTDPETFADDNPEVSVTGEDDPGDPDPDPDPDPETEPEEPEVPDDDTTPESKKIADSYAAESYAVIMTDGTVKEFALSFNDKISALTTLVNEQYADQDSTWYSVIVYDKDLVMVDYFTGAAYRQGYKCRSGIFSLSGDRISVKPVYLSADEEAELDNIRSNYSLASEELDKYHKAEEKAAKEELMVSDSYKSIFDKNEYKDIKIEDYTLEELTAHLDEILLNYAKQGSLNFSSVEQPKENKNTSRKLFGEPNKKTKKGRYGGIFKKK